MQIATRRYGQLETVEVTASQVFDFTPGPVGFEQHTRFALIPEGDSPIEWLQSLDDPAVAFAVVEPFLFLPEYAFEIADADATALGLQQPGDAAVRCVLTVREQVSAISANLMAPIVLNPRARTGRQVVLQDSGWPLRFPVLERIEALGAEDAGAAPAPATIRSARAA
jgi:flagellar assembly factor FliW